MNALVFPGQGSQKIGMAKAMVDAFPWASEMARSADKILGRPLSKLCFEGPEDQLKETINTQPAIFLASAILAEGLKREGFEFHGAAGHSLGEYSALFAAGAAGFEDLIRLVDVRARAMEQACPSGTGAMAAVMMLARDVLESVCSEASELGPCVVANYNCPGQLVISGARAAVEKACSLANEKGAKRVVPLEVSGPFHSPLMGAARDRLSKALDELPLGDAKVPVYSNIDGAPSKSGTTLKKKLLDQMTGSVRWEDGIQRMYQDGFRLFVELGPGKVVTGLIRKIVPEARTAFGQDPESLRALLGQSAAGR